MVGHDQRRKRHRLKIEPDIVFVTGDSQIQIRSRVDRRSIEGQLTRIQDDVAAINFGGGLEICNFKFVKIEMAHRDLSHGIAQWKFHPFRLFLWSRRRSGSGGWGG